MAEPPYKRARRPDSKQMWDEADRRAPLPSRERDEPPRDRRDDRDRDRNRRYRSRSPRDSRGGRGGDRDRRRDDRDVRDSRGGGRGREGRREDDRVRDRGKPTHDVFFGDLALRRRPDNVSQDGGRDKPRQRSREKERERERERDRDRDSGRRITRSRSPRRDRERDDRREKEKDTKPDTEKENGKVLKPDEEPLKSRTATPPVSFKVGAPGGVQDHDRMDVDSGPKGSKKGKKGKAIEEDDEAGLELRKTRRLREMIFRQSERRRRLSTGST